jgi:uncharacterized protein YdhG (YjbR/CyaY superfamily)
MPTKRVKTTNKKSGRFTDEEVAAMKEHARELRREGRLGQGANDNEAEVLAKINEMSEPDRSMAKRVHALVKAAAPMLSPKTWYGMPAYAKDGKVVCFFQNAAKFKARYTTLGFSDQAKLDDAGMWPTSYALKELTADEEARISALIKKAIR